MEHLERLTSALIDAMVEAVTAGLGDAAADHATVRSKGDELRGRAAMLALLGPSLFKLARTLLGEVERRSVPRYAAYYAHVRYSSDALINELDDARCSLNHSVLAATGTASAMQSLQVALSVIRVRAVTIVLGPLCIAEPQCGSRSDKTGPELRRRDITADDIPREVGDAILAMTRDNGDWDVGFATLRDLEFSAANTIGIVTSLIALAEQDGGRAYLNTVATRLERARFDRERAGNPAPAHRADGEPNIAREVLPPAPRPIVSNPGPSASARLTPQGQLSTPLETKPGVTERFRTARPAKPSARERLEQSQAAHARHRRS